MNKQPETTNFNPDIIANLLSDNILLVEMKPELGRLRIRSLVELTSLPEDQRETLGHYMNAVLKELRKFIEEKGLSNDCFTFERDDQGNVVALRITLTPMLYNEFIQRLTKNLMPEKKQEEEKTFNPTPLSMKPSLKRKREEEEEAEKSRRKSPFAIPSPGDKPELTRKK